MWDILCHTQPASWDSRLCVPPRMKAEGHTDKTESGEKVLQGSLLEWELGTWLQFDETVEVTRSQILGDMELLQSGNQE